MPYIKKKLNMTFGCGYVVQLIGILLKQHKTKQNKNNNKKSKKTIQLVKENLCYDVVIIE